MSAPTYQGYTLDINIVLPKGIESSLAIALLEQIKFHLETLGDGRVSHPGLVSSFVVDNVVLRKDGGIMFVHSLVGERSAEEITTPGRVSNVKFSGGFHKPPAD